MTPENTQAASTPPKPAEPGRGFSAPHAPGSTGKFVDKTLLPVSFSGRHLALLTVADYPRHPLKIVLGYHGRAPPSTPSLTVDFTRPQQTTPPPPPSPMRDGTR
jgi:hypothetical protein